MSCNNDTDTLTIRTGQSAPPIKNPAALRRRGQFLLYKRGNYESGMRKLKLLLLWDLDLVVFIVIVLLASKSLVSVDIPAEATLRLGTVIKASTVPTL